MDAETHIVVVDDDEETRNELRDYLSRRGCQVSTADGGEALRRIVDKDKIDLVVLDLIMPGEDGFALTDMIRRNCDSGVIILSAVGDPADQVLGLELGARRLRHQTLRSPSLAGAHSKRSETAFGNCR